MLVPVLVKEMSFTYNPNSQLPEHESTPMDPDHHSQLLLLSLRHVDIEVETILVAEVVKAAVGHTRKRELVEVNLRTDLIL